MGRKADRMIRNRPQKPRKRVSNTSRIRIKTLPALHYEGFDLSSFRIGDAYDVEQRLADLLIERGHAEPVRP